MSRSKGTRSSRAPHPDPESPEEVREPEVEGHNPENGTAEAEPETATAIATEEPAQVQLTIKGSDKSARAAAKRFGEGAGSKPPQTVTLPNDDVPENIDPISALLSDGKNMVLVTRQKPRTVNGPDGADVVANVRIPGKYECPTSIAEIEEMVFEQHGGSKYKCTIHPDTSDGANKTPLGHFTINHPDPKCPPFISGVTTDLPQDPEPENQIPTHGDPHLRETDGLVKLRADAERRLERARVRKEMKELEAEAKRLENEIDNDGKPAAPLVPPGESDEIRKLREQNAVLMEQLKEKKVNDRFDKLEDSIARLAAAVTAGATAKPAANDGDSLALKMLNQSQQHAKDMIEMMKDKVKPAAATGDGDLDKMLDRLQKLQALTGTTPNNNKGTGRLSELESRLIDMSWKKLTGGDDNDDEGGDPDDMESVAKLAIKQFAPIAKTFVEKKLDQAASENGGGPLTKQQIERIYSEASEAATKKIQDDLSTQGLRLAATTDGKIVALPAPKKAAVPPRHQREESEVRKTADGGTVKVVRVQPADLSEKKPVKVGEEEIVQAEFPGLGPNGTVLKVEIPPMPGAVQYDRKRNVNFILDSIRSEIVQQIPKERPDDSFVIGDAMDLLDGEILERISNVETGDQMEAILSEFGDAARINEIKEAGKDEAVKGWLRRLVLSMGDAWRAKKAKLEKK